jgi:hypothetical protein
MEAVAQGIPNDTVRAGTDLVLCQFGRSVVERQVPTKLTVRHRINDVAGVSGLGRLRYRAQQRIDRGVAADQRRGGEHHQKCR